jgi:hypothetical protein
MTKLPYKEFAAVLADLERYEHTRHLAEAIKDWLTALHRVPEDVHSFALSAENALGALFYLEMQCGPVYDVSLTFKDKSEEKARFSLVVRGLMTWADMLKAVRV